MPANQKNPGTSRNESVPYQTVESAFERKAAVNLFAQNISPDETENQGEGSARLTPNPSVQSATQTERGAGESNPEQSDKPQLGPPFQPANPPASKSASPEISPATGPPLRIPPILLEGDQPSASMPAEPDPKFALGLSPAAARLEPAGLPQAYGTNRLWLAARDPHSLYARWDLSAEQQQNYTALASGARLTLRVHLDTVQHRSLTEVQLPPERQHCFIAVAFAGRCYLAELGYYQKDQLWRSIAVSEPVSTPQEGIAQAKSVVFATIPRQGSVQQRAIPPATPSMPEAPQQGTTDAKPPKPQSVSDTFKFLNTLRIAQSTPEEALFESSHEAPFPSFDIPQGLLEAELISAPEWSLAQEQALARIIDWSAAGVGAPSSAEIGQWLQLPLPLGRPGVISSYLQQGEISSPPGDLVPGRTDFWLSVNAELIIYGATESNARLTIAGRTIQLRPDGTFSFRFALPDGRYELPIEAFSAHGHLRRAYLEFRRASTYQGDVRPLPQDPDLKKPDAGNVQ